MASWLTLYLALTAIIAARYLLIAGFFHWLILAYSQQIGAVRLMPEDPKPATVRKEIFWSVISSFIYAAPATLAMQLWLAGGGAIYSDLAMRPLWWLPVSILVYLFLQDTYFYWTHRLMHLRYLYQIVHKTHHQSRPPTAWAAFSFHPYESLISAWFLPALTLVIPIHIGAVVFILFYMTVCAVLNHCGREIIPQSLLQSWPGQFMITATHHNLHHKNYQCNYGLYFRFWDRLLHTDSMEYGPELKSRPRLKNPESKTALS